VWQEQTFSIICLKVRLREPGLTGERLREPYAAIVKSHNAQQIRNQTTTMPNRKTTAPSVGSQAARVLQSLTASATAKTLAASALSQRAPSRQTGAEIEDLASRVLNSPKYSPETKSLAGSVLSQANKQR
jgi:hypothetical protein